MVTTAFPEFNDAFGCEGSMLGVQSPGASTSASIGDVHFHGFNRQAFDFNGMPGKFYCLISDHNIQINALFRCWNKTGGTSMEKIGVKIGNQKCGFTYLEMDQDGACKINNTELKVKSYFPSGIKDFYGDAELTNTFAGYDPTLPEIRHAGTFENACLEINAGHYSLKLIRSSEPVCHEDESPYFVNLVTDIHDGIKKAMPHGIIGQTVNKDCASPEGNEEDYEVSSLFANDFKFNRFNPD